MVAVVHCPFYAPEGMVCATHSPSERWDVDARAVVHLVVLVVGVGGGGVDAVVVILAHEGLLAHVRRRRALEVLRLHHPVWPGLGPELGV